MLKERYDLNIEDLTRLFEICKRQGIKGLQDNGYVETNSIWNTYEDFIVNKDGNLDLIVYSFDKDKFFKENPNGVKDDTDIDTEIILTYKDNSLQYLINGTKKSNVIMVDLCVDRIDLLYKSLKKEIKFMQFLEDVNYDCSISYGQIRQQFELNLRYEDCTQSHDFLITNTNYNYCPVCGFPLRT